jgi:serine/threonine protein phosphatase 1
MGQTRVGQGATEALGIPQLPGRICIDTWAYGNGWLTGLDVATETFVQTSQRGEIRRISFDEVRMLTPKT